MKCSYLGSWTRAWTKAALAIMVMAASTSTFSSTYKCVDDKGVTHYGDTMPWQCAKKPFSELSEQGTVKKTHEGALNPEQLKARQEELVKKREEEKKKGQYKCDEKK